MGIFPSQRELHQGYIFRQSRWLGHRGILTRTHGAYGNGNFGRKLSTSVFGKENKTERREGIRSITVEKIDMEFVIFLLFFFSFFIPNEKALLKHTYVSGGGKQEKGKLQPKIPSYAFHCTINPHQINPYLKVTLCSVRIYNRNHHRLPSIQGPYGKVR